MGACKYCKKDAGWFSNSHDECEKIHNNGVAELKSCICSCFQRCEDFYLYQSKIKEIIAKSYIQEEELKEIYINSIDSAMEQYLNDGVISSREKSAVARFIQFTGYTTAELNRNGAIEKMLQCEVLVQLLNGQQPTPQITVAGSLPFMLEKNESLIWVFRNVTLHQQKIRREYQGRNRGFNIRVCKGIYYRTGGFKGTPGETTYMDRIGVGMACLTTKHIYFSSPEKSIKIPYDKILSVETYSNGVGLQKDGANDKPIFLEGMDAWFSYNVISNLKNS